MKTLAVTGASGFVGRSFIQHTAKKLKHLRLVIIDKVQPDFPIRAPHKFYQIDLREDESDHQLLQIFRKENCHTLLHAALQTQPPHNLEESHELHSIGGMYLLNAAEAAKVKKLILISTTDVYGAYANNPNFLTEEHPLRGGRLSPFLKDKIDVEEQFHRFAKKHPDQTVTVLRLATILGPKINNFKTNFLQNDFVPSVMGFDPLLQFVHENDVLSALEKVIRDSHPGIFNIVGDGVLPLSRAIKIAGKMNIPIPSPILYPATDFLWYMNIAPVPSGHLNFLKYPCIGDGSLAQKELEFKPVFTSQEALLSFVGKNLKKKDIERGAHHA